MKKIAFFIYNMYTTGGTEKAVSLIANELSKKNEVKIFSLYKTADKPAFRLNDNIEVINVLNKELSCYNLIVPYLRRKIKNVIKIYDIDVFINAGMKYVPVTIRINKRSMYIAWEHYNSFGACFGSNTWFGRKLASKYADKIVVLTDKDRNENIRKFKTSSDKIVRIYNPIEFAYDNYLYKEDSKLIVSCGRICTQKGFDMLIEVAKSVFNKHPDWQWHIFGDGEDRDKIKNLIDDNNLQDNVILMGRTNKMNELYKDYSMFVMTSRYEGFAMVNIEAHFAKLPIVSFNCNCGPDEIIQDGINGYLIECFNLEKMANKINYLIENKEIRKKMSDNALLDKEKLQMENIIKEWEKII